VVNVELLRELSFIGGTGRIISPSNSAIMTPKKAPTTPNNILCCGTMSFSKEIQSNPAPKTMKELTAQHVNPSSH
jgi:hypothetical protein